MCLLITQERGSSIEESKLQTAYDNNNDGAGYCFVKDGKIEIKKYRNFKKFFKAYEVDVKQHGNNTSFIVHFRIGTHGESKGTLNVHPFKVSTGLVFAHNGMISKARTDKKYSDTQTFNQDVLQGLPDGFYENMAMQELIAEYIGASKLAFLNEEGDITIINEHMGHWDGGVWFSNDSYKDTYGSYGGCYTYGGYGYTNDIKWSPVTEKKPVNVGVRIVETDLVKATRSQVIGNGAMSCEWCGEETNVLHTVDVADRFNGEADEPYNIDMCTDCVHWETKKLNQEVIDPDAPNAPDVYGLENL